MEGYKDIVVEQSKYNKVFGQVFHPLNVHHSRSMFEFKARKFISDKLPLAILETVAKVPISAANGLKKGAKDLRMLSDKLDNIMKVALTFTNGDWIYVNNKIYAAISRLSEEERNEFNCDVQKIDWDTYTNNYIRGI